MLKTLKSLFGVGSGSGSASVAVEATAFADVEMSWYDDTRLPLPVWEDIANAERPEWTHAARDAYWTAAAGRWLQAMAAKLPSSSYRIHASADFLLLSALDDRPVEVFMQFCQSLRRRIARNLLDIATERGGGKHVVMVFASEDEYYDYIAHYYPDDGGEYAMSSGMFIQHGYGHFVLFESEMEHMQPVIAHELTHCMLSHLPIPAWLNEGLAVNTEEAIFPHLGDPQRSLYGPHEIGAKHAAFWNAGTIQEFWSGKSFLRSDDGNMLSYDLAKRITAVAARDEDGFRAFVLEADLRDAGASAGHWLGYPLERLVIPVLGAGDWRPDPARWRTGTERGQFRAPGMPGAARYAARIGKTDDIATEESHMSYAPHHLQQEPARADVDALPGVTVLEFGTPWCPHCIAAQPLLEAALSARDEVRHLKIEDGPGKPLGRSYRIKLWPSVLVLRDGEEVARAVRPASKDEIERALALA